MMGDDLFSNCTMTSSSIRVTRLKKELKDVDNFWPKHEDRLDILEARLVGPSGTPYQDGIFQLRIEIPDHYPFEPPRLQFMTRIYHPNIGKEDGIVCFDVMKSYWKPTYNIRTALDAIKNLMMEPNPNEPVEANVAKEFLLNKHQYETTARQWTKRYANGVQDECLPVQPSQELDPSCSRSACNGTNTTQSCQSQIPDPGPSSTIRHRLLFSSKARVDDELAAELVSSNFTMQLTPPVIPEIGEFDPSPPASTMRSNSNTPDVTVAKSQSQTASGSARKIKSVRKVKPKKSSVISEGKGQKTATSRQQKRPRYEDLFLDDDDNLDECSF